MDLVDAFIQSDCIQGSYTSNIFNLINEPLWLMITLSVETGVDSSVSKNMSY